MSNPIGPTGPTSGATTPTNAAAPARQESQPAPHVTPPMTTGATTSPFQRPTPVDNPADERRERIEAFTRLLLGAALEVSDELWLRLKLWQEQILTAPSPARPETAADRLRFALVGLVFEEEERILARLRRMQQTSMRTTEQAMNRMTPIGRRMMRGPLRPVGARLSRMLDSANTQLHAAQERWTLRGQFEEQRARLLARQAVASLTGEIFDRLEHDEALQEFIQALITQQGTSLATTAVESARERGQAADDWVERMVHGVLKRPAHEQRAADHSVDAPHSAPANESSRGESSQSESSRSERP